MNATSPFGRPENERRQRGQYATPDGLAAQLAVKFRFATEVRLLDAGAGDGALLAAVVQAARESGEVRRISIAAVELDPQVVPRLKARLAEVKEEAAKKDVIVEGHVYDRDFVDLVVNDWLTDQVGQQRFTHVILNPPYVKLKADSPHAKVLRENGIQAPNLYAAFLALTARLLEPGGQLVAITPRSFCNGPHFTLFRQDFLSRMRLRTVHLFDRRNRVFRDDGVLQECIILSADVADAGEPPGSVVVSASADVNTRKQRSLEVPYDDLVHGDDKVLFLPSSEEEVRVRELFAQRTTRLTDLDLQVSTGPVVDFRVDAPKRVSGGTPGAIPLIYPAHFDGEAIQWPLKGSDRKDGLEPHAEVESLLFPPGVYVVLKRMSSKEQGRRIGAAVYDSAVVAPGSRVGFENHVNVIHRGRKGLPMPLAVGLVRYLNSKEVDTYVRIFSGHTQINVADLRELPFPPEGELTGPSCAGAGV